MNELLVYPVLFFLAYAVGIVFAIIGSKLIVAMMNRKIQPFYNRIPFAINFISWLIVIVWSVELWLYFDVSAKINIKGITDWYYGDGKR